MDRDAITTRIGMIEQDLAALRALLDESSPSAPDGPTVVAVTFPVMLTIHVDRTDRCTLQALVQTPNVASMAEMLERCSFETTDGTSIDDLAVFRDALAVLDETMWIDAEYVS